MSNIQKWLPGLLTRFQYVVRHPWLGELCVVVGYVYGYPWPEISQSHPRSLSCHLHHLWETLQVKEIVWTTEVKVVSWKRRRHFVRRFGGSECCYLSIKTELYTSYLHCIDRIRTETNSRHETQRVRHKKYDFPSLCSPIHPCVVRKILKTSFDLLTRKGGSG